MTLTIVDSCLRTFSGHHFEYARALVVEARSRGWATRVYAHKDVSPEITRELGATPVFSRDIHSVSMPLIDRFFHGRVRRALAAIRGNIDYFRELASIRAERETPSDVVLFHTITHQQVIAILLWRLLLVRSRTTRAVLLLRYRTDRPDLGRTSSHAAYRLGFLLARLAGDRVMFTTDSSLLADAYARLGARNMTVLPIPHAPDPAWTKTGLQRQPPRTVILPGYSSLAKGLGLLTEALRKHGERLAGLRFLVQASDHVSGSADKVRACIDELRAIHSVTLLPGSPDTATYYHWFCGADAALVVYDVDVYAGQTSGVFAEALSIGLPVITSGQSWMAKVIRDGLGSGLVLREYTADALADALCDYRDRADELARAAQSIAPTWRDEHSAGRYLDLIAGRLS